MITKKICDLLATTLRSRWSVANHSTTTSPISDFQVMFVELSWSFWTVQKLAITFAIGHARRGMRSWPFDDYLAMAMLITGRSQRWSPPMWHGLKFLINLMFLQFCTCVNPHRKLRGNIIRITVISSLSYHSAGIAKETVFNTVSTVENTVELVWKPSQFAKRIQLGTVKPVLRDHCQERPHVLKDHTFLAEGPTFECN